MKYYIKRQIVERGIAWLIFLLFIRFLCDRLLFMFSIIEGRVVVDYGSFDISDWLINFEAGFVRRGLAGHILWLFEQLHIYDVRIAIAIICFVSSVVVLILIIHIFKKEGWSILIVPTGFILGYTLFGLGGRRDLVSLLLTYVIFWTFKKYLSRAYGFRVCILLFYLFSIIQILFHEASFFYTFPILIVLLFERINHKDCSLCKRLAICFLWFFPIFIAMALVCFFKGDQSCAEIIWNSWSDIFKAFPDGRNVTDVGAGVDALAWRTGDTFVNHLKAAYLGVNSPSYFRIIIVLYNFCAAYFLISRINMVDMGVFRTKQMDNILMSNVLLIQFVAMIPMFTVLSCDWGRTIPYWILSTLFFYHIFGTTQLVNIRFISKTSRVIQGYIDNSSFLYNKYMYMLLVLLSPVPGACAPFDFANTFQQGIFTTYCAKFCSLFLL